jgi:hypothetical protein
VFVYTEYARRRPTESCQPDDRFYLQPLKAPKGQIWFSKQALGKNSIANLARNMSAAAGLQNASKTNHSARKTAITTLLHNHIPPTSVMQLTGHKNVQSLNEYSSLSVDQQRELSLTLSSHMPQIQVPNQVPTVIDLPAAANMPICTADQSLNLSTGCANFDLDDLILADLLTDDFDTIPASTTSLLPATQPSQPVLSLGNQGMFSFANSTIHGNVTMHMHQHSDPAPAKVRRLANDIARSRDLLSGN